MPHTHKECAKTISDACLNPSNLGLLNSPSVNRCASDDHVQLSIPSLKLSQFLFKPSNSPAFLAGGFLTKPLALLCPHMAWQHFSSFPLVQPQIIPLANLQTFQVLARSCEWMWEALSGKLSSYFFSFNARVFRHPYWLNCYILPILTWTDGKPRLVWSISANYEVP